MTEQLMFGRPQNAAQAKLRLPTRQHPEYNVDGGPMEELAHLNKQLSDWEDAIRNGLVLPLGERRVPLSPEAMRQLERRSFCRDPETALTAFDAYTKPAGTWQISKMKPEVGNSKFCLICLKSQEQIRLDSKLEPYDPRSEFEIFLLTFKEPDSLKSELNLNQ